jgi:hypothetical protein
MKRNSTWMVAVARKYLLEILVIFSRAAPTTPSVRTDALLSHPFPLLSHALSAISNPLTIRYRVSLNYVTRTEKIRRYFLSTATHEPPEE